VTAIPTEIALDAGESRHLCDVLRARAGDPVELTDGRGALFRATFVARSSGRAHVRVDACAADPREQAPPLLRLTCAVVKGRRFEWALEKAVEIGAHAIVPLASERGVVDPGTRKQERWRGLVRAAMKQAHRTLLPELAPPASLAEVIDTARDGMLLWGAAAGDASAEAVLPSAELPARLGPTAAAREAPAWLTFLVGPEGGWSEAERARLDRAGAVPVQLGPHVLRTETAAVAGLLALQALRRCWLVDAVEDSPTA
jgi:16S rRNA (uracil1498-N3)-methyltransferase